MMYSVTVRGAAESMRPMIASVPGMLSELPGLKPSASLQPSKEERRCEAEGNHPRKNKSRTIHVE
jgi:hypothetical protein